MIIHAMDCPARTGGDCTCLRAGPVEGTPDPGFGPGAVAPPSSCGGTRAAYHASPDPGAAFSALLGALADAEFVVGQDEAFEGTKHASHPDVMKADKARAKSARAAVERAFAEERARAERAERQRDDFEAVLRVSQQVVADLRDEGQATRADLDAARSALRAIAEIECDNDLYTKCCGEKARVQARAALARAADPGNSTGADPTKGTP